jgi:hypothetical protein
LGPALGTCEPGERPAILLIQPETFAPTFSKSLPLESCEFGEAFALPGPSLFGFINVCTRMLSSAKASPRTAAKASTKKSTAK